MHLVAGEVRSAVDRAGGYRDGSSNNRHGRTISPGDGDPWSHGFMVPVRDVEALRSAMEKFTPQPELARATGVEGLKIARKKYGMHKVNAVIVEAIKINE